MEHAEEPVNLLQQLAFACAEARQAFATHTGMSQPRLNLLMLLASRGELSHAFLQRRLLLDGATTTRLIKQFEAEGIVSRRLDPDDNRYTLVALTASGQQVAAGLKTAHDAFQARLLEGISTDEQAVMLRGLARLRANLRDIQDETLEELP